MRRLREMIPRNTARGACLYRALSPESSRAATSCMREYGFGNLPEGDSRRSSLEYRNLVAFFRRVAHASRTRVIAMMLLARRAREGYPAPSRSPISSLVSRRLFRRSRSRGVAPAASSPLRRWRAMIVEGKLYTERLRRTAELRARSETPPNTAFWARPVKLNRKGTTIKHPGHRECSIAW